MYYLIYVSAATELMNNDQLLALLEQSRRNNERHRITGMLLYKSGNFMQYIDLKLDPRELAEEGRDALEVITLFNRHTP